MGRNKRELGPVEPSERKNFYRKRKLGYAKKANDISILCDSPVLALSFSPDGKADLVLGPNTNFEDMVNRFVNLSPKERYESKLEGIKALKKAFKDDKEHVIDEQYLMNLGRPGTSRAIQQGQQSSINMEEEIQRRQNLCAQLVNERLNIREAIRQAGILLKAKRIEISKLREARARASQDSTNQAAMNHSGPLNGNMMMNHRTNLLQSNIVQTVPSVRNCPTNDSNMLPGQIEDGLKNLSLRNSDSNSDPLFGLIMGEPPEDIFSSLDDLIHYDN
ncbi:uncharacterized protein LOC144570374 [Carex rostrata]